MGSLSQLDDPDEQKRQQWKLVLRTDGSIERDGGDDFGDLKSMRVMSNMHGERVKFGTETVASNENYSRPSHLVKRTEDFLRNV